jgi:hypothetical protein
MAKISGTYTIKTADQPGETEINRRTVLTVEVTTQTADDAAHVAEVLGTALERLGLGLPSPGRH